MTVPTIPEWVQHLITAILSGVLAWGATIFKVRADNRKTNAEAGSEIVEQAQTVVEMWKQWGQQAQAEIADLKKRITALEADGNAKADRIKELEEANAKKDERIAELEREVERLQAEIDKFKPRKR